MTKIQECITILIIMTSFEGMDPGLAEAAQRDSVVDELLSLVGDTNCAGCPVMEGIIKNEGARIDTLREAAANKDFFDTVAARAENLPDDQIGFSIVGVEGINFIAPSVGGKNDDFNTTGTIFEGMLDYADDLEGNLRSLVTEKTSGCPGTLNLEGHDMKTRQVYKISSCSDSETIELGGGQTLSRVELRPDV